MDFALPADLVAYLAELDRFIALKIRPLEDQDDNIRFFDHRRYRVTEGSEEIQKRKVAGFLLGYMGAGKHRGGCDHLV